MANTKTLDPTASSGVSAEGHKRSSARHRWGPGHAAFAARMDRERRAAKIVRALDASRPCAYPIYRGAVEESCRSARCMVTFRESGIAVMSCGGHAGICGPWVAMPRTVRS